MRPVTESNLSSRPSSIQHMLYQCIHVQDVKQGWKIMVILHYLNAGIIAHAQIHIHDIQQERMS